MASLPEAHGFCWKTEVPVLERRQQLRAWGCVPIPPSTGQSQELGSDSEGGLQLAGQKPGLDLESQLAAELEAFGAEEAEKGLSPGELPRVPRRGSILEKWYTEVAEGAQEGVPKAPHRRRTSSWRKSRNSGEKAPDEGELQSPGTGSKIFPGPQRGKSGGKKLEGPWDLETLQRQLQQDLDFGECGAQHLGSPGSYKLGREVGSQQLRPGVRTGLGLAPGAGWWDFPGGRETGRPWHGPLWTGSTKRPWKALRAALQVSARSGKAHASVDDDALLFNLPDRSFHRRQEATR